MSPQHTAATSGLSAYLEDIVSDEEPMIDDIEATPPVKIPASREGSPPFVSSLLPSPLAQPSPAATSLPSSRPSKDELLAMMEKVDRNIASVEQQIQSLENSKVS